MGINVVGADVLGNNVLGIEERRNNVAGAYVLAIMYWVLMY